MTAPAATPIVFCVPAVPVAQPRQRHRIVSTKLGGTFVSNYTPTKAPVNAFKATVRLAAATTHYGRPLEGPLRLDAEFVFPRPSNLRWKRRAMPRQRHWKKPDRDNCEKALLDAMRGLMFLDDAQVCDGSIQKWIAAGDEQPHVKVTLTILED